YYRNTNTAKTITSNGVSVHADEVYFEEETSVSLLDDLFLTNGTLHHDTGTLTTNNHKVSVNAYYGDSVKPKKLNMGSSEFYITGVIPAGVFSTASSALTLDTGTSHIHFTGVGNRKLLNYAAHNYYYISFNTPALPDALPV
ncbi:hypothetical protein, partial [Bacillus sp. SIMBA_033]|uniref:hypothetical protein n=1 Tax=Bacillus sp. SIMBA_033 TaxID=3085776 RepID=UPI00397A225B